MRETYEEDDPEDDYEDDPDDGYVSCPYCGGTMLEVADHCPNCNRWITSEDLPEKRQPLWIIMVVLILVAMMILSFIRF